MAAESASNFLKKFEKPITRIVCKINAQFQRLYPHFLGLGIHWSNYLYCMVRAEVRNPRWRLRKMKYLYLSKYTIKLQNSSGDTHVFKVEEFKEAISYTLWCKRIFKIQDGGSQTGNTYISACIQHNCTIPTAIPMFSRSRNSIKLLLILYYASGSQKSKMAAHKPEILISQPVYNITAQFQRLYPCFRGLGIQ